jgi:hypothetical protein
MAGVFTNSFYLASYGAGTLVHPIRVQPETLAATISGTANGAATGPATSPIQARVNGTRREIGLRARSITLQAPATAQPTGYKPLGYTRIPCLTPTFYNLAIKGAVVSYLGASFTVVSQNPEQV